ncbi:hypothetical protein B9Z55_006449 [Caenorhabditis nigoni]|uniref:Uncharacterized protein n=1 Tax=Caenorhabditis nigoni TaxID=1611254 RepID=A0A2G5V570_9PELO|nr:hypothetical protein B9Z55_006449 [Caenorhabditis nigoni]
MEFDENADRFRVCGGIHIKYVASFCAFFGICATIGVFSFGLMIFPWHLYEDSVNTTGESNFFFKPRDCEKLGFGISHVFCSFLIIIHPSDVSTCFLVRIEDPL